MIDRIATVTDAMAGGRTPEIGHGFHDALNAATSSPEAAAVNIAEGVDLSLTRDQQRLVGRAIDRATTLGASHAVVMIDGISLTVDVGTRTVTGRMDAGATPGSLAGEVVIDAGRSRAQADSAEKRPNLLERLGLLGARA